MRLHALEDRVTPSFTNVLPPSYFLTEEATHPLSEPSKDTPAVIAEGFLARHLSDFHLVPQDIANVLVTDQYTDADTGTSHVYLRQLLNGLEIENANLAFGIDQDGRVISAGGGFVSILDETLLADTTPHLTPSEAVHFATIALNGDLDPGVKPFNAYERPQTFMATNDLERHAWVESDIATAVIPARLHFVPTADGTVVLAWQLNVQTYNSHWFDMSIDAATGTLVSQADWTDDAGYQVVAAPNASPQDGGFTILADPANAVASPFGWHDTNGVAGPEFTTTVGNNVDAHLDRDANNVADPSPGRPDGGASLNFSAFTFHSTQAPTTTQNQMAAQVNLFSLNNFLHDVHYAYGFTPAAGNFQTNTYGQGGSGNDAVQADAQDGSGTNNANFSTPADGSAGRMQMYLFTATTPNRDGDFDSEVVFHEYGHGVSNRLTGGPSNDSALTSGSLDSSVAIFAFCPIL